MEQVLESIDGCCTVNKNVEERPTLLDSCYQLETLDSSGLSHPCNSGISGSSELQLHDDNEQCDKPNTNFLSFATFLACTKDISVGVCALSLLASKVKALCKIITSRLPKDDAKILKMALYSTRLSQQFECRRQGTDSIRDLLVANVRISCGQGKTKKVAICSAHSNATMLLQQPYLHLEESSDETLRLVGSNVPLDKESYDVVTKLDVISSDFCLPVLDLVNCDEKQIASDKLNQLVVSLNHVTSMVRTMLHVLTNVRDKDVIDMALLCAKVRMSLRIIGEQPYFCGSLLIDGVLVASVEKTASTKFRTCKGLYAAAVKVFCKPYMRLEGSPHGGTIRLVGSEEPFDRTTSGTLQSLRNDELDQEEAWFVSAEKLPSCADHHSVLPPTEACAEGARNDASPAALLSTAGLPAIMTCFHHLSDKVKALFSDMATGKSAATIVMLALKAARLSSYTCVVPLTVSRGYRCDLHIVSVHVAKGEAAGKTEAMDDAYTNAAKLLQKPYLRLVNLSTMLVGSDEPLVELPSDRESQHTSEIAPSSPAAVDPVAGQRSEITKGCRGLLILCAENSLLSETDNNVKCQCSFEGCLFARTSVAKVSELEAKQMPNVDSSEKLPCAASTLLGPSNVSDISSRPGVQSLSLDDALSKQEPVNSQKTVVIARSQKKDLSYLVGWFRSLANIAKDVFAMFKSTKTDKDMFLMAVNMSHMSLKYDILRVHRRHVRCQLLVDGVIVAIGHDCSRRSAKMMAYSTAAKVICMPYLCLDETRDNVQMLGSEEPFMEMLSESGDVEVNSFPSRGFWSNSSVVTADGEHRKDLPPPNGDDLSRLVARFHRLVCRIKAVSESAVPISNSIQLIEKALAKSKMRSIGPIASMTGAGYHCELFIGGVEISSGNGSERQKAKHAAYSAAVELLQKPYLRLQENPESSQLFRLVGSERPFVGVLSGVLPRDQTSVTTTEEGQLEDSPEPEESADDGDKWHCPDGVKLDTETRSENSSYLPLLNGAVTADESSLCETKISVSLPSSIDISQLMNEFRAFVQRVKCLSMSSLAHADIIEMAVTDTQIQKRIVWMDSIALQCRCALSVHGILVAYGVGDRWKQAKQAAYSAAVKLLSKPHLQLRENLAGFGCSYVLVGAEDTFAAASTSVASSCRQNSAVTDKRRDQQKRGPDCRRGITAENSAAGSSSENEPLASLQHFETRLDPSLADFVILRNHFKKVKKRSREVMEQSAAFNQWPLMYNVTEVEGGGYRCRLMLGSHIVADAVASTDKSAKKAAAEQALNRLTSVCYTIQKKKLDVSAHCVTRHEVSILLILSLSVYFVVRHCLDMITQVRCRLVTIRLLVCCGGHILLLYE